MNISLNDIYFAIAALEREADFRRYVGNNSNYERARDLDHLRTSALRSYRELSEAMPRLRALKAEADRSYDRYVTREPEGCYCHISPPCGFCTSQSDEEEAA